MRRRILVVDDDTSVREWIARVLEEQSYDVIVAATAREAVSMFLAGSPDLVLLDLNMPDEDGWEIFRTMHKLWPFVPVIIVTARPHQTEQAAKSGADALMEKPLDFPVLLNGIKYLLSEPERQRLRRGAIQDKAAFRFLNKPDAKQSDHATTRSSCAPNSRTGEVVARTTHAEAERNCVLLVDDDPSIREFLGRALKMENYDVVLARDGREAAVKYLVVPYDLVLLDLNMPRMDGWEVLHTIQQMQPLLPVIVITARPHQYERAVTNKVDALMEKPLDLPLLLKAIRELLAQSIYERVARLHDPNVKTALLTVSQEEIR
ncbi:MAG TPA: response regulator [Candidatus Limnocylindria bacterium]|nr:response regulator [Candidatus Limnocylindria bacterium]